MTSSYQKVALSNLATLREFRDKGRSIRVETAISIFLLFGIIATVNARLLFAYFQVDDFNWLRLAQWQSVVASFHGAWGHGIAYRPISRLSFYLDALVFGWHAGAWHAENLVIYSVVCGCVYALGRSLRLDRTTCILAAVFFAVSPLGSENVD